MLELPSYRNKKDKKKIKQSIEPDPDDDQI
jgi:hypothetical protein